MATLQIPKITYKDKKDFQTQGQDDEYKICAKDMNEIKSVFNNSAESIEKGLSTIDENVKKTNDARDLTKQYMEQASQDALAINGTANGIIEKVTTEDGYAQINDSSNRRLNNMIIRGNSEQIQTTGKNLLLIYKQTQTVNGITLTYDNDNKVIIANGTSTSWTNIALGVFDFKKGVTYKFVGCPKGGNVSTSYHIEPNGGLFIDIGNGATYTPSEDKLNIPLYFVVTKGVVLNNLVIKPMITTDLNATYDTYEPYTGGQPSPSPEYPQEIKAVSNLSALTVGKNLCGGYDFSKSAYGIDVVVKNSTININGTPAGNYPTVILYPNGDVVLQQWWLDSDSLRKKNIYKNKGFYAHDLKEKTLQIDFDGTFDVNGGELFYVVVGYETYGEYKNFSSKSTILFNLSTKERINYIAIGFTGTAKISNFNVKIQLKYDKNKSDFISYQGQSILNYTLQNPLYKLGDTQDYIDLIKGKIIRNVGVVVFDGSDDENYWKSSDVENVVGVKLSGLKDGSLCLCNKLISPNKWSNFINNDYAIYAGENYFYIKSSDLVDVSSLKSFLNQNQITVVYQLATPTEEDIPAELLSQLKELQTYVTTTNVMFEASDVYPIVDLEYIADTKTYIDNKFKELAEVIITSTSEEELKWHLIYMAL